MTRTQHVENVYGEYVAGIYGNYGATLTLGLAASVARSHGTTLPELVEEGLLIRNETVKTLNLFEILGY